MRIQICTSPLVVAEQIFLWLRISCLFFTLPAFVFYGIGCCVTHLCVLKFMDHFIVYFYCLRLHQPA